MKKLLTIALTCLIALVPWQITKADVFAGSLQVLRVIDGDTLEVSGGERVRLLGLNAPEKGQDFYLAARKRLKEITALGNVELDACEDRDIYGRTLATVRFKGGSVNNLLLREGLALPMLIPPCGRRVAREVQNAAVKGILSGRGLYSLEGYRIYSHTQAVDHIGEKAIVRGTVTGLHKGRKAWHLNFGQDWRTDFTAVLFKNAMQRYRDLGLDPEKLVGSEVLVIGKVKRYNGPEIIVKGPEQILPLGGNTVQNPKSNIPKGE